MYLIALTGGIASGKSFVAALLRQLGAVHIDADSLAREVVEPETPGLSEIVEEFGVEVLHPDGSLNRPALGALVFGHQERLARLNAITHPRVRELTVRRVQEALDRDDAAVVVYDVPLFSGESIPGIPPFDAVVVVHADAEERIRRMMHDRGMAQEEAERRIAAQVSDEERLAIADVVLDNNGTRESLAEQVHQLWASIPKPSVRGPA